LAYSIRNTVQQFSAFPIIARDLGAVRYTSAVAKFYGTGTVAANKQFVTDKSQYMKNRAQLVNREAAEFLSTIVVEGKAAQAWELFKRHGFTPQTYVDMAIAFPAWTAKYEMGMDAHSDPVRAARDADTLVSETVGSGADVHLGTLYRSNQNQWVRTLTMFGSWFNTYYNRMYRATKGGTDWANWEAVDAMLWTPVMVAVISAALIQDGPEDEESVPEWVFRVYRDFMFASLPFVRDAVSVAKGFPPEAAYTPLVSLPTEAARLAKNIYNDTKPAAGDVADTIALVGSVVPLPGSGQIARVLDYVESYETGGEYPLQPVPVEAYQALVKGGEK